MDDTLRMEEEVATVKVEEKEADATQISTRITLNASSVTRCATSKMSVLLGRGMPTMLRWRKIYC